MNRLSLLLLISFISSFAVDNSNKQILVKTIKQEILVDGQIDEIWSQADSITDFYQFSPIYDVSPTEKTVAKILRDNDNLYVLLIASDLSGYTQYRTGNLDDRNSDVLTIMLDTFNDNKTAYKFGVSASSWRLDCLMFDDGRDRDYSWDGIWWGKSEKYDWGFVIEMKIPFNSIRYDKSATEWGLDFDRWIPAISQDIYWAKYDQHSGMRISNFGKMIFEDPLPGSQGINLEFYPVALINTKMIENNKYESNPHVGLDVFYNPAPQLTLAVTLNPDFAQIEADPFNLNVSRYETYFSEQRNFFIEGTGVFRPEATGSFDDLELFYSRRIGKKLPNGDEVPLNFGGKVFGRIGDLEYGGLVAKTGSTNWSLDGENYNESDAIFSNVRLKEKIFTNSTLGGMFVGKWTSESVNAVLDIDGSYRNGDLQLGYQFAKSITDTTSDYAVSAGFNNFSNNWITFMQGRYIGEDFNVDQIGYVPWKGSAQIVFGSGPRWFFENSEIKSIDSWFGGYLNYEKYDDFIDKGLLAGMHIDFKKLWGFEMEGIYGKSKDENVIYNFLELRNFFYFNTSPTWSLNASYGYSRLYNFAREQYAPFSWVNTRFNYYLFYWLNVGSSVNIWWEGNQDNKTEELTINTRPFLSISPINYMKIRLFADNLFFNSTQQFDHWLFGVYFGYNFSPKSWIYFSYSELQDRTEQRDEFDNLMPNKMHVVERDATLKIKYLYYF